MPLLYLLGAVAGAALYSAANAGTKNWDWTDLGVETVKGAALGFIGARYAQGLSSLKVSRSRFEELEKRMGLVR